jgi:TRAP-type C4-dicarboxylate transport system permease small subunit
MILTKSKIIEIVICEMLSVSTIVIISQIWNRYYMNNSGVRYENIYNFLSFIILIPLSTSFSQEIPNASFEDWSGALQQDPID